MSATTTRSTWHLLPTELKLAVVESLANGDLKSLSRVDQRTYQACVPALFKVGPAALLPLLCFDAAADCMFRQHRVYGGFP